MIQCKSVDVRIKQCGSSSSIQGLGRVIHAVQFLSLQGFRQCDTGSSVGVRIKAA